MKTSKYKADAVIVQQYFFRKKTILINGGIEIGCLEHRRNPSPLIYGRFSYPTFTNILKKCYHDFLMEQAWSSGKDSVLKVLGSKPASGSNTKAFF